MKLDIASRSQVSKQSKNSTHRKAVNSLYYEKNSKGDNSSMFSGIKPVKVQLRDTKPYQQGHAKQVLFDTSPKGEKQKQSLLTPNSKKHHLRSSNPYFNNPTYVRGSKVNKSGYNRQK